MLLELRQLSESLAAANVTVGQRDDHLVGYSKAKPVFRVTVDAAGEVQALSMLENDVVGALLKYEVSKGGSRESAPGFNVPPLFEVPGAVADDVKALGKRLKRPPRDDTSESRRATVDAITARCESGWTAKKEAIGKCLCNAVSVMASHLDRAEGTDQEGVAPLRELLRRIDGKLTIDALRDQLIAFASRGLAENTDNAEGLFQLLFQKDAVVLLELADWGGLPANHQSVWEAFNRVLLAGRRIDEPDASTDEGPVDSPPDAFGESYRLTAEKMPERRLPRLGNVKLRSNSASKPCQARYGWEEGDSFPVALEARGRMADSLRWLTADEREGHTFRDISNACGFDLPALLLAYPDPLPSAPPALAAVLAKAGQQGALPAGEKFAAAAEILLDQLKKLEASTRTPRVTVFVLAKRDTARTKLLFSRQFSAERIIQAIGEWRQAAANIPPVFVRRFGDDRKPIWHQCDDVPYPNEVARCLNRVWQRGGERVETVAVFDFSSALTLLLDDGRSPQEVAATALRLANSQWTPLLLAMGQATTLGEVCPFSQTDQPLLPPILGLLLAKLGHRKEVYMKVKALPYWLGCLCATADRMHREYCKHERDGKLPNGPLVGNSAMAVCLENPQAGLAQLSQRLLLYQRVVGQQLSAEAAEIAVNIDADNLPNRATDEHKAQMLLGYLTRPDLLRPKPLTSENQS